jgi:mono/diheme cytochrome c family protein
VRARTRSPSHLPGKAAIGTKALGLLFLRRKVATDNGNGSGGNEFGTQLTEDERWAIIEYLKTL